ncbi:STAS domain-containing protein [Streptomyces sp. TLI_171]|uniref:STAS domain-containing protein n=1 Tax=Streptomyces sp. TLI_171 TaxID=1938859 RepID=UPI000C45AD80|nr:STAS domain-containing protein [Streptomyces sp. TLI_171]RKE17364.1 anti-sigma B factor antagonist [Streptomyces sp. TLI_171]
MPEYALTIEVRTDPLGATVVSLAGELDYHTAPRLHRAVERTPPALPLVLDLTLLRFCDSLGMAELLFAFRRTQAAGTALALAGTTADVGRLLTMTGVDGILPRHDSVEAALRAVRPPG